MRTARTIGAMRYPALLLLGLTSMAGASEPAADSDTIATGDMALADADGYEETGYASWYGAEMAGRRTANGERFDPDGLTGAHRTLPFGSYAEVTMIDTGARVVIRINDRGPHTRRRLIDISYGAAVAIGMVGHGVTRVRVRAVTGPGDAGEGVAVGNPAPGLKLAARTRYEGSDSAAHP